MTTKAIAVFFFLFAVVLVWLMQLQFYSVVMFIVVLLISTLGQLIYGALLQWIHVTKYGQELPDPFFVEVLLDGVTVAILSERRVTDMFWRTYHIRPVSREFEGVITNDDFWNQCRFTFRDPVSTMTCDGGFAGGKAPFVRFGEISLRAMYFKPTHDTIA